MVCTKNFVGGHPVHVVVVGVDLRDPMRGSTGQRSCALHVERMLRHWLRKRSRRMGVSRRRCAIVAAWADSQSKAGRNMLYCHSANYGNG